MNSFLSIKELESIGFKCFGKDVLISKKASLYGVEQIIQAYHLDVRFSHLQMTFQGIF